MISLRKILYLILVAALLLASCAPAATPTAAPPPPTEPQTVTTQAPAAAAPTQEQPTQAPVPTTTIPPPPTPAPTTDPNAAKKGGTLIVGSPQEPGTLSPLLSSASIEDAVSSFIVEGLVQVDADGKYAPILAQDLPKISADGTVVTYTLRPGIKFSDGSDLTCDDVKFTKDAILADLSKASTSGYKDIDAIDCSNPTTVVVKFAKVYAPYLRLFSFIVPRSAGDLKKLDSWDYNRKPVGTGPWMLKEWQAGDHLTLVPNPNYREKGKPYLDSVIVKILPSREAGMQLLGTGEINALWDLAESDFPALKQLEGQGVGYAAAVTGENELLVLNLADPKVDAPADPAKNPHPILSDPKVRQALQMGIDKDAIVKNLLYGNVKVGTTVLPVGQFACPQPASEFNVEKAKAMLKDAGWEPGKDGIRLKNGVKLELKISTTSGNQLREQTEQVLVEMFQAIGVSLKLDNVPSDVLFGSWEQKGMRKHGKFDILLYTTGPGIDPDSHLYSNYHSNSIPSEKSKGAGNNYSRYISAEVDKWIDDASATADMQTRQGLYCKVATQINKDIPRIYLYERLLITGYRTNVQNFRVSPGPSDFTINSQDWWIKK